MKVHKAAAQLIAFRKECKDLNTSHPRGKKRWCGQRDGSEESEDNDSEQVSLITPGRLYVSVVSSDKIGDLRDSDTLGIHNVRTHTLSSEVSEPQWFASCSTEAVRYSVVNTKNHVPDWLSFWESAPSKNSWGAGCSSEAVSYSDENKSYVGTVTTWVNQAPASGVNLIKWLQHVDYEWLDTAYNHLRVVEQLKLAAGYFYYGVELTSPYYFSCASQLNGCNGEWTNSDDLDVDNTKKNAYNNRKRQQKEANNKKLHGKAADGKHSKVEFGPPEQVTAQTEIKSEKPTITYYSVGINPIPGAIYQYLDLTPTLKPLIEGFIVVPEGQYKGCISGSGWFGVSSDNSKNKELRCEHATKEFHLEGYRTLDSNKIWVEHPAQTYQVYMPLFTSLNKQFRTSVLDNPVLNALNANSKLGLTCSLVEDSTFNYIVHLTHSKHALRLAQTYNNVLVTNNSQLIGRIDSGYANSILESTTLVDHHKPVQIPDDEYDGEVDWEVRHDVKIVSVAGDVDVVYGTDGCDIQELGDDDQPVAMPYHKIADGGRFSKLSFKTTDKGCKSRHRTRYFTFKGRHQKPMVEYSNSNNNLNHGLKRLIACRENWEKELQYRRRAIKLAHVIAREFKKEHKTIDMYNRLTGSRQTEPYASSKFTYIEEGAKDKFMTKSLFQVFNGCTRSIVDQIVDACLNGKRWLFLNVHKELLTAFHPYLSREAVADLQHIKRKLRKSYVNRIKLEAEDNLLVRSLEVCIKRELAKFGKAPRLYMAYGAGCIYAPELPEFVKMGINGKHVFHATRKGVDYTLMVNIMAKPKPDSIDQIFKDLYDATSSDNYVYVAIYSDDSVYAGKINGHTFCFNGDVSSNDSSQDAPAFLFTYLLLSNFHERRAWNLIEQCMLPINVVSPEDTGSRVTLQFDGPFEGSGTTLTTILNHVGSMMIALSFFYDVIAKFPEETIDEIYKNSAEYVGHSVTVDNCIAESNLNFHHVQFLKRSPFRVDGEWRGFMNLGAIFKNFGDLEDDMQATQLGVSHAEFCSMSNSVRCDAFMAGVVKGWKNESSNPILKALRERFVSKSNLEVKHDSLIHVFDEVPDHSMYDNSDAIRSRYGLTSEEIWELVEQISNVKVGQHYSSYAMAKIMELDYGVGFV